MQDKPNPELIAQILRGHINAFEQPIDYRITLTKFKKKGAWGSPELHFDMGWVLPNGTPIAERPRSVCIAGIGATLTLTSAESWCRPFVLSDFLRVT